MDAGDVDGVAEDVPGAGVAGEPLLGEPLVDGAVVRDAAAVAGTWAGVPCPGAVVFAGVRPAGLVGVLVGFRVGGLVGVLAVDLGDFGLVVGFPVGVFVLRGGG
ncbi:hypothetical protein [Yinghuangia soli]|uniref:Uncharacterized protein n=1 Tax=Yinghuangia soli TaxID=2908204 RepID=A0AA41Q0V8_9ACTN|nr:hypothetical protein [Yinghuangia soli]MCF2528399.1 hypothetical protein [Yinghuangia soli]